MMLVRCEEANRCGRKQCSAQRAHVQGYVHESPCTDGFYCHVADERVKCVPVTESGEKGEGRDE